MRPLLRAGSKSRAWSAAAAALLLLSTKASLAAATGAETLEEARRLYGSGRYFTAASRAFEAKEQDPRLEAQGYALLTESLVATGLVQASSYFFIRTLQSGDRAAIRFVLRRASLLLERIGPDLLGKYLVRHTEASDYDARNRGAYHLAMANEALLSGDERAAIARAGSVDDGSPLLPLALQIRGAARALLDEGEGALRDFRRCVDTADRLEDRAEARDLSARCQAGVARTLYQLNRFEQAEEAWDRISKQSIIWPDILFEQAWNAYARNEFNRALGRLVTYKSPALSFVFNPEVDALRAQTYLGLCLYADSGEVIREFGKKYTPIAEEVKAFVEKNAQDLGAFHELGKDTLRAPISSRKPLHLMANRFVRSPYFAKLVRAEDAVRRERAAAAGRFSEGRPGAGLAGFLEQVATWRLKSIRLLGGAFVRNGLIDHHASLIEQFEKVSFMEIEMLGMTKDALLGRSNVTAEENRLRGNVKPRRRDHQYSWSFNGEFWNDELGDYVFGLETACDAKKSGT